MAEPAAAPEGGRERLLQAAIELISERGYAATSVGAVCERAGVAKPALYWHFENKEGLLAAVLEAVGTGWVEEIQKQAYLEGDAEHRIQRLTDGWRELAEDRPQLLRLLMIAQLEQGTSSARIRAALVRVFDVAERAIVQGIEDTLGRTLPDLDLVAHTVVTLLQGAMLRHVVEPNEQRLERNLAELRRTLQLAIWIRLPDDERHAILALGEAAAGSAGRPT